MQKTLIALSVFVALSSTSLAAEISKNADVVVVGGGAAGLPAAVQAAEGYLGRKESVLRRRR